MPTLKGAIVARSAATSGGCWLWKNSLLRSGYGRLKHEGQATLAHRAAWLAWNGAIPQQMCVCHRCDVRHCVNPEHLFLGSHADNSRDMARKGRHGNRGGESSPVARLSAIDVEAIRASRAPARDVAGQFGVTKDHVLRIRRGARWNTKEEVE